TMLDLKLTPSSKIIHNAISVLCEAGCPRTALGMMEAVLHKTNLEIAPSAWMHILTSSAANLFADGVESAWQRLVHLKKFTPNEGLVLQVLSVAARCGRPALAIEALEILSQCKIRPMEHHLAPLLEAYVNAGQVQDAMSVLSTIRHAGMIPTMRTAQPIVEALPSIELIDRAFYAIEDSVQKGQTIDITALNAVIKASVLAGDIQRARGSQTAAVELRLNPNIDTFNIMLEGCVRSKMRALGDTILSEMKTSPIAPDAATYEHMIRLCLTQEPYDDAFYYLERMKSEKLRPSLEIYEALAARCAENHDRRWKAVLDEVSEKGYRRSATLQRVVQAANSSTLTVSTRAHERPFTSRRTES
ncbi:hypothetical protein TREMEDRAFT_33353, partial [Tremella mesenterica DSM 1558]|uniref:uncharacterized protein n=1 Tax=Tremella mesenterica (strain ATCC 24925 / CBS 8224 / DSM 1558 / NBRC 9311 / NRRL Y-6157 / RJB 2259-6 / UBC 559-6) TaxID=578456 RepID=UPI0003F4A621